MTNNIEPKAMYAVEGVGIMSGSQLLWLANRFPELLEYRRQRFLRYSDLNPPRSQPL